MVPEYLVLSWVWDAFLRRLGQWDREQETFRFGGTQSLVHLLCHRVREEIYGGWLALAIPMRSVCETRGWSSLRVGGKPVGTRRRRGSSPWVAGDSLVLVFPEVEGCETSEGSSSR